MAPLVDETVPRDVLDSLREVQNQLRGNSPACCRVRGIPLTIGKPGGGDRDEDIVVRITGKTPVLPPTNRCQRGWCSEVHRTRAARIDNVKT